MNDRAQLPGKGQRERESPSRFRDWGFVYRVRWINLGPR